MNELQKEVEELRRKNAILKSNLKDCRNELCLKCGKYREAHNGACDDCRWDDEWRESLK